MTIRSAYSFLLLLACSSAAFAAAPAVVPLPAHVEEREGRLELHDGAAIAVAAGDEAVARWLAAFVQRARGIRLVVVREGAGAVVSFERVAHMGGGAEAYRLEVTPRRATIVATDVRGLRHGAATLLQLIDDRAGVDAVVVADAPRFAWRGLMLDSARHFQSPAFIRDFLDWMAVHKLNVLHWHLVDDQGWRLEIRKYPKLTSVGAWRVPAGPAAQADIDPATGRPRLYGGFYTQDTVRELVAYAAERGITVVPEIEMPGHASAALAAYPELAAGARPPKAVPADWGIYDDVYAVDDATFAFLEDVLTETMELFPSPWIHVGGDEVQGTQWAASPAAQARMRELGIEDAKALQHDFTQRMARFLARHGRRLVGWDEILAPGMPSSAVVMSWRGVDGAIAATARGN
ncbi:MAG TPA: beta-N-acetylhexosaminidase, partial [Xanthomonadales bacterium]|nr:beta-N-acetylhexosaminidase [Xanthomonadales bacterium]